MGNKKNKISKKQTITPDKVLKQTTEAKEVKKPLNIVVLFAFFLSIFVSIIGFFLTIYSIIDMRKRNEKGMTLAVITMIICVVKLGFVVYGLMNYDTVSTMLFDQIKKYTTTTETTIVFHDENGNTIPMTTTAPYTGPTTAYNKDKPDFDENCWTVIYTGYCDEENIDEKGDTLCHYYKTNEKAKEGELPLKQVDIRCPLYYLKNTN